MSKPVSISFPVVSFRHIETPFQKKGYKDYFAVVDVSKLPDLTKWREINVRDPKLTGAVPRAILEGFRGNPELFLFMNRGIVISAERVSFDNKTSNLEVVFSNTKLHGLLDGGHTYSIIMNEVGSLDKPQYVKVEILEGFDGEDITNVVDARNTSNQVRDESLMNHAGAFKTLQNALKDYEYFDQIAFKEYELDKNGEPKPIDVRDIIAILTAFDRDHFTDQSHPIISYSSKAACLKHFGNDKHKPSFEKLYPLAHEILCLYDEITLQLPDLYNRSRKNSGEVSGGKFGKLTGVTPPGKHAYPLYFIGKSAEYGVPAGLIYPILGAFRSMLIEKGGRYVWGKGINPREALVGSLGEKLANTLGAHALEMKNPNKTGKSSPVWKSCYQEAEIYYLRA